MGRKKKINEEGYAVVIEPPVSGTSSHSKNKNVRSCRACGCTDDDCSQCIEESAKPCYWVEEDLCSNCLNKVSGKTGNTSPGSKNKMAELVKGTSNSLSLHKTNHSTMSKILITKGKLLKGDKIEVEYKKPEGTEGKFAKCSEEHSSPPHKDLKNAFADLAIHAALLGEFVPITSVADIENIDLNLVKDFNVSGFTVTGGDDDEGVILSAQKTLKTGKPMGFNTPLTRFGDESETAYQFLDELSEAIGRVKDEMREYLNGNKKGNDPQGKLFDENEN